MAVRAARNSLVSARTANSLRLLLSDDRFAGSLSGGSLPVEDALDEVLWTDPPMANYAVHYPIHDVVYEGVILRAGHPLVVSLAAANTDPSLTVDQRVGNRAHLAWSAGPHNCPAQSLRLIAAVAVEKLLDRLPDVEPAVPVEELTWRPPLPPRAGRAGVRFPPSTVTPLTVGDEPPVERSAPTPQPSEVPEGGRVRRGWAARLPAWWPGE